MTIKKYKDLIKFNISMLVLVTTYIGYYLGLRSEGFYMIEFDSWRTLSLLLIGTFLIGIKYGFKK